MQYLVEGTGGPGFKSPEEVVEVLERAILPGFEHLIRLQAEKKVLAGGPAAFRSGSGLSCSSSRRRRTTRPTNSCGVSRSGVRWSGR